MSVKLSITSVNRTQKKEKEQTKTRIKKCWNQNINFNLKFQLKKNAGETKQS